MKKFLSVILGLTLIFSLVGCSSMNKKVLTAESFKAYFEGKEDYEVPWLRELLEDVSYNIMKTSVERELKV